MKRSTRDSSSSLDAKELRHLKTSVLPALAFVLFIWLIRAMEVGLEANLSGLGIYPRRFSGLVGVLASPLIHGTTDGNQWSHILHNTLFLVPLITAVMYFHRSIAPKVFISLWIVTGIWVWCFARPSFHIGASGLVYGLASFLFFIGVFRKNPQEMALSAIILLTHSGLLYAVFPSERGVSWESHLMGLVAGIVTAWYYRKQGMAPKPAFTRQDSAYNFTYDYDDDGRREAPIQIQYHYKEKEKEKGWADEKSK